jgi:hypothetical protein
MDITDFDTVQDSLKDTLKWTCQLIIDNKLVESASPELIDLCQIGEIGSPTVANQDHLPKGASYRFPPLLFLGNEYGNIETTLKNASNKGGFKIIRPRSDTKERSKYRGFEATFICTCGVYRQHFLLNFWVVQGNCCISLKSFYWHQNIFTYHFFLLIFIIFVLQSFQE